MRLMGTSCSSKNEMTRSFRISAAVIGV